jgi:small subunit ribosomal protein S15
MTGGPASHLAAWCLGVFSMSITVEDKGKLVKEYQIHGKDTGSPEVQIAILTHRINELRAHFEAHKKDHSSRRGLLKLVSRRNQLLKYLTREDRSRYQQVITRLGLRK